MDHKIFFPQELAGAVVDAFSGVFHAPDSVSHDEMLFGVDGVLSTIYIKGDIVGKVSIFLRAQGAAAIVGAMLCVEDLAPEAPETLDGMGELLNMIAGRLKTRLDPHKVSFDISEPSTRMTSIVAPGRWENNLEQSFSVKGIHFRVLLSYRVASKEDKIEPVPAPQKIKLTAAELLKQVLAKKKT
ncbi:MAG: chemotaxis protein CheX [Candidatus Omnitrophota bacterium]